MSNQYYITALPSRSQDRCSWRIGKFDAYQREPLDVYEISAYNRSKDPRLPDWHYSCNCPAAIPRCKHINMLFEWFKFSEKMTEWYYDEASGWVRYPSWTDTKLPAEIANQTRMIS